MVSGMLVSCRYPKNKKKKHKNLAKPLVNSAASSLNIFFWNFAFCLLSIFFSLVSPLLHWELRLQRLLKVNVVDLTSGLY